jgi:hypothetical protein
VAADGQTASRGRDLPGSAFGDGPEPGARTIPRMNPTVLAAAIGVGGTVVVGVAGFWAAVRNTGRTIVHARENRIWDRGRDTAKS